MKPETKFWQDIAPSIRGFKQRMEVTTSKGIPDVYVCYKGKQYWIEVKEWSDSPWIVRKEQHAWGKQLSLSGGLVLIVAKVSDTHIAVIPMHTCKIKPYGTQEIYLEVLKENIMYVTSKNYLQETLQKFLFT